MVSRKHLATFRLKPGDLVEKYQLRLLNDPEPGDINGPFIALNYPHPSIVPITFTAENRHVAANLKEYPGPSPIVSFIRAEQSLDQNRWGFNPDTKILDISMEDYNGTVPHLILTAIPKLQE